MHNLRMFKNQYLSLILAVFLAATLSACAPKFSRTSGGKNAPYSGPGAAIANFFIKREVNSEGSNPSVLSTTNFNVSKTSIGGNFNKTKGTSASFIVQGGMSAGL